MAETNYAPDPRTTPQRFYESRGYGPGKRAVFKDQSPNPPTDRTKPALSYTAAGVLVAWNPSTQAWVSIGSASSGSAAGTGTPTSFTDSLSWDDFEAYSVGAITALDQGSGWFSGSGLVTGGTIVSRTISGSRTEKRLSLVAGELLRKMPWAEKWKALRIGVLMRINAAATFTGELNIGVNSGIVTGFSGNPANWVGATTRNGNSNAFTFNAGNDVAYFGSTFRGGGTKRAALFTDTGGVSSGNQISGTEAFRTLNIIDIRRARLGITANTYAFKLLGAGTAAGTGVGSAEVDVDSSAMLSALMSGDTSTTIGWFYDGQAASLNITDDETTGAFDSLSIAWSNAVNPLELSAIGVFKLA